MPRYAVRGGDIVLKCEHSVPPEQLYKVEWRKGDNKIFQYIKGRKPPFRYFSTAGATLNVSEMTFVEMNILRYLKCFSTLMSIFFNMENVSKCNREMSGGYFHFTVENRNVLYIFMLLS